MNALLPLFAALALSQAPADDLPERLRRLAIDWPATNPVPTVAAELRDKLHEAGLAETAAWRKLAKRGDWESFRDQRIENLRASLGAFPPPAPVLEVRVRKTLEAADHHVDCLTYESRPGLVVTANLYRPAKPGKAMPGFIIVHSHHNSRTQGELQDMGALWARAGCLVLVLDQLGHGERRQHPFRTQADYKGDYRVGRQDYYFRYNTAVQLQTLGDSLMGWMVWDISRGVDLLLAQPGIDPKKIVLLGSVAGGGDPAAVAAALDKRITAAAVFNFGGPQPETRYPLPADAEANFLYTGSGSWESTRNLARSARDGFLPWVIVGGLAPRRLVYAHEFSWDEQRDPAWKRLQQIYSWYEVPGNLASVHGSGSVQGKPPESTHCNNIGTVHRKGIHTALKNWFDIDASEKDLPQRRPAESLLCLGKDETITPLHRLAGALAEERMQLARQKRAKMSIEQQRAQLRKEWGQLLGDVNPVKPAWEVQSAGPVLGPAVEANWIGLPGETWVWGLVLTPKGPAGTRRATTVAFAQGGPQAFLRQRGDELARLLRDGNIVVLADLDGLASLPPAGRGRSTSSTSLASSMLMLGQPALGDRLRELRTLLAYLRQRPGVDGKRLSLWGDSFAAVNPAERRVDVPLDVEQPAAAEPMGAILGLLCGLFEDGLHSLRLGGGLVGYRSLLDSPFVHVPYDVIVPGALTTGDLVDLAATLAPTPLRFDGFVDGVNRPVPIRQVESVYAPARAAYRTAGAEEKLVLPSAKEK